MRWHRLLFLKNMSWQETWQETAFVLKHNVFLWTTVSAWILIDMNRTLPYYGWLWNRCNLIDQLFRSHTGAPKLLKLFRKTESPLLFLWLWKKRFAQFWLGKKWYHLEIKKIPKHHHIFNIPHSSIINNIIIIEHFY